MITIAQTIRETLLTLSDNNSCYANIAYSWDELQVNIYVNNQHYHICDANPDVVIKRLNMLRSAL